MKNIFTRENASESNNLSQLQEVMKSQHVETGQEKKREYLAMHWGRGCGEANPSKYKSIKQLNNKHLALEEGTELRSDRSAHNSFTFPFQQEALCLWQLRK